MRKVDWEFVGNRVAFYFVFTSVSVLVMLAVRAVIVFVATY